MGHLSYEDSKKLVFKGLILLGVVTLIEVFVSLLGKGHVIGGLEDIGWLVYPVGFALIALSLYKAYYIVYFFMHMEWEVKSLRLTVLLPMLLLVWAIIAFMQEGSEWGKSRQKIKEKDAAPQVEENQQQGMLFKEDTYILK